MIGRIDALGVRTYAHQDGLGSTRLLTNQLGVVVGSQQYDAFGSSRGQVGAQLAFTYTGEQVDAETGFVYLRARYMDPGQGRFVTKDPLAGALTEPATLHDYVYVANNPMRFTDPSGLTWEENAERFFNWVFEQGDEIEYLGPGDPAFEEMLETPGVAKMRREYAAGGLQSGSGGVGHLEAFINTIKNPFNGTQAQVGGYLYLYMNNCDGTVTYEISNALSARSFFYQIPFVPHYSRDSWFPLMGDQIQIFRWTEPNPIVGPGGQGNAGGGGPRGFR